MATLRVDLWYFFSFLVDFNIWGSKVCYLILLDFNYVIIFLLILLLILFFSFFFYFSKLALLAEDVVVLSSINSSKLCLYSRLAFIVRLVVGYPSMWLWNLLFIKLSVWFSCNLCTWISYLCETLSGLWFGIFFFFVCYCFKDKLFRKYQ